MCRARVFHADLECLIIGQSVLTKPKSASLHDRGDVFYHPDIHTHDSCLNEIGNQLFILIIGGRFGGKYVADPDKSIVKADLAPKFDPLGA